MIDVNVSKKFLISAFIFLLTPYMNSCIMMPFTMGSMLFKENQNNENPDVVSAVNKLIRKSSEALMDNRGPYEHILLNKTETDGKSVPPLKLRSMILKTLRSENLIQVFDGDERAPNTTERIVASKPTQNKAMAVLNIQLYYKAGQMMLAQQLVDLRSHKIYWSELFAESAQTSEQSTTVD